MQKSNFVLTTIVQLVINMGILDNLEATLFPEEAGNGEIIQDEIPFEIEERLNKEAISFLQKLVERIDMKIIKGPFASYVDKPGNRGLTAIVMIETSHIAFHIWDEEDPGLMQFDLYTCGELNLPSVLLALGEEFKIISLDYNLFDREKGFVLEDSGHWPEEGSDYKI